jgi:hypothetical protein
VAPPPAPYAGPAAPHLRTSEAENESDHDPRDEHHALGRPEKS